jgi:DNA-directed RNA polymerase specialized sigma24 family protein
MFQNQKHEKPKHHGTPELVRRGKEGDQHALLALLQRYKPAIARQLRMYHLSEKEQMELSADVLVVLARHIASHESDKPVSQLVYRVTKNIVMQHMHRNGTQRSESGTDPVLAEPPTLQSADVQDKPHHARVHIQSMLIGMGLKAPPNPTNPEDA